MPKQKSQISSDPDAPGLEVAPAVLESNISAAEATGAPTAPPAEETTDDINAEIARLNAELAKRQQTEEGIGLPKVRMRTATVEIKTEKNSSIIKKQVTPGQLLVLVAQFKDLVHGNPVARVTLDEGGIEVDPIAYRQHLCGLYKTDKVMAIYPGVNPAYPQTFGQAIQLGMGVALKTDGLFMRYDAATGQTS